ncbi:TonB-dependent receptor [Caulobacter sp.]|uniref:TonB-dependent receptor plug domain-containing protein n=1 Tax=Caulobacter sp. TaxID=78 RepID=UPI001B200EEF|nr:TonB-dependent receptor [Caulobacter sp.]MBO9546754.1 TonB-dependent receptor [Caulobacter sp.]
MLTHRRHLLASTIIAGLAVGVALPAMAQTAAPLQTTDSAKDTSEVEAVVVTGSRIKRNEFNSPDPVQVITADQGRLKGIGNTAQLLQSSTIASGSPQITAAVSSAFVTDGGPGSETISLRGLGANRTLVLLNGRRAGPAGVRGGVSAFDLNVLPVAAIDRVEILKDGASSVYGSDAVAGVVNIITKRGQDGFSIDAFASQPQRHGGQEFRTSAGWGKTFSRGFFNITYDYAKKTEQSNGQRAWTNCGQAYIFDANGKRKDTIDPRTGTTQCRDLLYDQVWLYTLDFEGRDGKLQYDYGNNLGKYISQYPAGKAGDYPGAPPGWFVVGDSLDPANPDMGVLDYNSPYNLASSLTPRTERNTVFAQASFDVNDHVEAYGEVLLNRRATKTNGYRQIWTYLYTEDYGDPFSAGFTGDFILSPTIVTPLARAGQKVDYQRYVGGLRGDFGANFLKGWDWDIFAQYSHNKGLYSQDVVLGDALNSADGRSDGGSFGIGKANSIPRPTASCVGYTTPISKRKCVDVNWMSPDFLAGKYTPEEQAFLFDTETGKTIYKQLAIEGSVSGDLFKLPAGTVGAAFGVAYRKDEINDTPGAITQAGNIWGSSTSGITAGKDTTKEIYGELSVPLVKSVPFIQSLDLSLSGRYTDVNSYGSDQTYKVGLNWQIIPSVRVRATRGTSFRAPALFELYKNAETGFVSQRNLDPCIRWQAALTAGTLPQYVADNCKAAGIPPAYTGAGAQATVTSGGGAGSLEAETSKATTYGVIWTPKFADLKVAVDYFDIRVNNEITQLGAARIVNGCYRSLSFPTDKLCTLFTRGPSNLVTTVTDNYLNIATQVNKGLDLTVNYGQDLPWDVRMDVELQSTWQFKDTTALFADTVVDSNGFVGDPDWTGQLNFRFTKGDWAALWGIDMVGKASDAEDYADSNTTKTTFYKIHTEFTAYHSLSLQKKFENFTVLGGVANLFDEAPPQVSQNAGNYNMVGRSVLASQYDYIGRRMFVSFQAKF